MAALSRSHLFFLSLTSFSLLRCFGQIPTFVSPPTAMAQSELTESFEAIPEALGNILKMNLVSAADMSGVAENSVLSFPSPLTSSPSSPSVVSVLLGRGRPFARTRPSPRADAGKPLSSGSGASSGAPRETSLTSQGLESANLLSNLLDVSSPSNLSSSGGGVAELANSLLSSLSFGGLNAEPLSSLSQGEQAGRDSSGAEEGWRTCEAGMTFRVNSEEDLQQLAREGLHECVYAAGIVPERPPIGIYYGEVLKVFDTEALNDTVRDLWSGKLGFKTQCKTPDQEFYMVQNFFNNGMSFPALMYVGSLSDKVDPREYDDGGKHLFIDYTPDMATVCPVNVHEKHNINLGIINDPFPANQLIDLVRIVGKTPEGGYILLGKSFLRNMITFPETGDRTAAFWYVISHDYPAFPDTVPDPIGPLPVTFHYSHYTIGEALSSYFDVNYFLNNPVETLFQITDYLFRFPMGLPPVGKNSREIQRNHNFAGVPDSDVFHAAEESEREEGGEEQTRVGYHGVGSGGMVKGHVSGIVGEYLYSGRVAVPPQQVKNQGSVE